jgi:hypothetical protein
MVYLHELNLISSDGRLRKLLGDLGKHAPQTKRHRNQKRLYKSPRRLSIAQFGALLQRDRVYGNCTRFSRLQQNPLIYTRADSARPLFRGCGPM